MLLGAVEIGLRSTRLTVSDVGRRFSRAVVHRDHRLTARLDNLDRLGALVMAEVESAREAGARRVELLAASELRGSRLLRMAGRFAEATGTGPIRIPTRRDRIAASFVGSSRPHLDSPDLRIGVARIDEDAVGIAVGCPGRSPDWVGSRPVGSASMTRKARFLDPPLPGQIEAAISGASRAIASLLPPSCERLLVSSPLAGVVVRLSGERPDAKGARRGLDAILGQTADDIAAWFGLDPGPARRLPGLLVGHVALAEVLGREIEPVDCDPVAARHWLAEECATAGTIR